MRLSPRTLAQLPAEVARPAYDPAAITCGILHLGVGNFHRAHQAAATEAVLADGAPGWGISCVSLRRPDQRDKLEPQGGLYSLTLREASGPRRRVIGALREIAVLPEDPWRVVRRFTDPRIRVVSLTVTEKGYATDPRTGELLIDDSALAGDLAAAGPPVTTLGLIAAGLAARAEAEAGPVTLLSCDNLPRNGQVLRRALSDFVARTRPDLLTWLEDNVTCPGTMVDRITPATTDALPAETQTALGLEDRAPVETEPFSQWVIEDDFAAGAPDWSLGGADFVPDAEPFERMKLRLLNGAHTALAAAGLLAGIGAVDEAMEDPALIGLLDALWQDSAATLPAEIDVASYTADLAARFRNRSLRYRLAQIAGDGAQKLPPRILAPLRDLRRAGRPHPGLTFVVAAWLRAGQGRDEAGRAIEVEDPGTAAMPRDPDAPPAEMVGRWMCHAPIFGDLAWDAALLSEVTEVYVAIGKQGVRAAAAERLGREGRG